MSFESASSSQQIISKQRVADHGEVYTHEREVNAMLDLVKDQTERIDATFLEPTCGNGNFLAEILRRKLAAVSEKYGKNRHHWARYALLAAARIYGIDLLADNVAACRARLLDIFRQHYARQFGQTDPACLKSAEYLFCVNIIQGDALTMKTAEGKDIEFAQWSAVNGSMMKRRDFQFCALLGEAKGREQTMEINGQIRHQGSLFEDVVADDGSSGRIFLAVRDYPPVHFLALGGGDE